MTKSAAKKKAESICRGAKALFMDGYLTADSYQKVESACTSAIRKASAKTKK